METVFSTENSSLSVYREFANNGPLEEELRQLPLEERPPIMVFGKPCRQHRNVGFFSDVSVGYRYSGRLMGSQPLPEWMKEVMRRANDLLGTDFNGVLVNHYVSGEDYISAHSDDEKGLAKGRFVASVSWGAERTFRIRDKKTKAVVYELPTTPGTLIAMGGSFQKEFTHEIPAQKKVQGERWSLTFRRHLE
jgi:alkylated DNA repair dioxygenase AlkB